MRITAIICAVVMSLTLTICAHGQNEAGDSGRSAIAQLDPSNPSSASNGKNTEYRWEMGLQVGFWLTPQTAAGARAIPLAGPISASTGDNREASYLFGTGAEHLNAVIAGLGGSPVASYDAALTRSQVNRSSGTSLGIHVSHDVTSRIGWEYRLDLAFTPLHLSSFARDLTGRSMLSMQAAINPLARSTGGVANSTFFMRTEAGRQLFNTLTTQVYLRKSGKFVPFLSFGGGFLNNLGADPSADLISSLQFGNGSNAVKEQDYLRVRWEPQRLAGVLVAGGGVKAYLGTSWGLRWDWRDNVAWETVRTKVFAFPKTGSGTANAFTFTGNGREISFSNNQNSFESTLGHTLNGFQTFKSAGVRHHINSSVGLFYRF